MTHPTVDCAVLEYLDDLQARNYSPKTIRGYRSVLWRLRDAGGHDAPVAETTAEDVRAVINHPPLPSTKRAYRRVLRAFFNFCIQREWVERNPTDDISVPRGPAAEDEYLSEDEIRALWKAASEADARSYRPHMFRRRALLLLLQGLDASETCNVRWRHLDWHRGTIRVERGSDGTSRKVDFPLPLMDMLEPMRESANPDEPLIHGYRATLGPLVGRLARAAGIERRVWPRTFRHSYTVDFLKL